MSIRLRQVSVFPALGPAFKRTLQLGLFGVAVAVHLASAAAATRTSTSLNGSWSFQRDGAASNEWKQVTVPSSFQSHEGTNFHGVGWYRKNLEPVQLPPGCRLLLHFQAAATEAEVWCDGERVGTHLGGWTPFRFDITDVFRKSPSTSHELRVRVDEKVGHNTQGFLPIIAPHFGGLWQDVSLIAVPETYVNDLSLLAIGDPSSGQLKLEIPLSGTAPNTVTNCGVRARLLGQEEWRDLSGTIEAASGTLRFGGGIRDAKLWSPGYPNLYEIEVALPGPAADSFRTRTAFRSITAFGPELRLNGQPLSVRGILNWGYSAPNVEPNAGEVVWRQELEFARANGFNLMKFCLWVPPKRYLDLADEQGVLTWMEYPTWHPTLTGKFLEPLRREFQEFFNYDRNHPSIVLRSLTCETGPSADLSVIRSLYEAAHQSIPGALVEDDSSWIEWNRVHDFYDDHPYGNNHTWGKTLAGFNEYILGHGVKPLVLGESISADTWVDREAALKRLGNERPWWAPGVLDDMERWTSQMRGLAGPEGLQELRPESLQYGMLMRKYQIEAFRREVPYGGYVITVLRDIPDASMGLLDYEGAPKWTSQEWQWHRDTMCLLETENDRRSFGSGETLRAKVSVSHFGSAPLEGSKLKVTLEDLGPNSDRLQDAQAPGQVLQTVLLTNLAQNCGTWANLADLDWVLPQVSAPRHLLVRAVLETASKKFLNSWPIWVVPPARAPLQNVQIHSSVDKELARDLFLNCPTFEGTTRDALVVASHFDPQLARYLESGGRVFMLPDGERHSFGLAAHWFLRGAPYIPQSALSGSFPREFLLELQHFDLAAQVVPELPQLGSFDPILMLWDTHDLQRVKTHGLVFETRVGSGRLLVSALRHAGAQNAAGRWLLGRLVDHLSSGPAPRHGLGGEVWDYAKARMEAEQTNLVSRTWLFKPDPANHGLQQGWEKPYLKDEKEWKDIRIGAWWESQGYAALDGWAWYRLWVDIPEKWRGRDMFLSFEGVDDIYELYVNGQFAGKGGDLATRKDALSEKKSHRITSLVQPGKNALIAVRVHDWYGAGGIFRPVTLGTLAINPQLDLLR